jgi:hypothetical protein
MKDRKPFTCHRCRRATDEILLCPVCKRTVCFKCLVLTGNEMRYAMREWKCERCRRVK